MFTFTIISSLSYHITCTPSRSIVSSMADDSLNWILIWMSIRLQRQISSGWLRSGNAIGGYERIEVRRWYMQFPGLTTTTSRKCDEDELSNSWFDKVFSIFRFAPTQQISCTSHIRLSSRHLDWVGPVDGIHICEWATYKSTGSASSIHWSSYSFCRAFSPWLWCVRCDKTLLDTTPTTIMKTRSRKPVGNWSTAMSFVLRDIHDYLPLLLAAASKYSSWHWSPSVSIRQNRWAWKMK